MVELCSYEVDCPLTLAQGKILAQPKEEPKSTSQLVPQPLQEYQEFPDDLLLWTDLSSTGE